MVKLNLKEQDVYALAKLASKHDVKMRIVGEDIVLEGNDENKLLDEIKNHPKEERVHIKRDEEPITLHDMLPRKVVRGGIYRVDFPTGIGSEQADKRLAIVIQNDIGNHYSPTTIVIPLTGVKKKEMPTHLSFKITPETMEFCNIKNYRDITNTALTEQIRTVDKERIHSCIGKLNHELMNALDEKIMIALGLKK